MLVEEINELVTQMRWTGLFTIPLHGGGFKLSEDMYALRKCINELEKTTDRLTARSKALK